MVATPINPANRFPNLGNYEWYWCPAIANKNAPTRAELNAGTNLSGDVYDVAGWTTSQDNIEAPDIIGDFTVQLPGRTTAEESSLSMYIDEEGDDDIRSVVDRKDKGFIVRFDAGDVPGRMMDVFPTTVKSMGKDNTPDNPAGIVVMFSITGKPAENIVVPAAA